MFRSQGGKRARKWGLGSRHPASTRRLLIETLEDRHLLSIVSWDGGGNDFDWHNPLNWSDDALPTADDDVVIDVPADIAVTHAGGSTTVKSLISQEEFVIQGGAFGVTGASVVNGAFTMAAGTSLTADGIDASFEATAYSDIDGASLTSHDGGDFTFDQLRSFTAGVLTIDGPGTFNAANVVDIDNSRFHLSDGAQAALPAKNYSARGLTSTQTLFSVDGPGTVLDLSALESIDDRWDDGTYSSAKVHTILASNGGRLDLSGVKSISAPVQGNDRLDIRIDSNGDLDLSDLETTHCSTNQIHFDLGTDLFTLPSLVSIERTKFSMSDGGTLNLPALLVSHDSSFTVPTGGTFNLPNLIEFNLSTLNLAGPQTFNAPNMTDIDGSRFNLSGGAQFTVTSKAYSAAGLASSATLFSADGTGTVLDLSSIETFNGGFDDGTYGGAKVHTIRAGDGGQIDLSNVETITGPVQGNDRLDLILQSGSVLDLSSLSAVSAASGGVKFDLNAVSYGLPLLRSVTDTTFLMSDDGTLDLPELVTATSTTFTVPTGGTYNLPKLRSFTYGTLNLGGPQLFVAPLLTDVNNSRFNLSGGAQLAVDAAAYSATGLASTQTLFSIDGAGTLLDLSSVKSFNDGFDDGYYGGSKVHTVRATGGGRIDLSDVDYVTGPVQGNDRLDFVSSGGGEIDLSELRTTISSGGEVRLDTDAAVLQLDRLEAVQDTRFLMDAGAELTLPVLATWDRGVIGVPAGGTFSFPELVEASNLSLAIGDGGTLSAEDLISFTGSALTLGGNQTFDVPPLVNIDNSRFTLTGGAQLAVDAETYSATGLVSNQTLFSVDGANTLLDLSSVKSLNDGWDDGYYGGSQLHTIRATGGGRIDLSATEVITAPVQSNDRLDIDSSGGGTIELTSVLKTVNNVNVITDPPPPAPLASTVHQSGAANEPGVPAGEQDSPLLPPSEPLLDSMDASFQSATVTDIFWISDQDGDWSEPSNWSTGTVPGASDHVVIDRPGIEITVTYSAGTTAVAGIQSSESLAIIGGSLTVTDDSLVDGGLLVGPGASLVASGWDVTFEALGDAIVDGAALKTVDGGSISMPTATSFVNGTLGMSGPGTFEAPLLATIDNSRFNLSGGATFVSAASAYSATGLASSQTVFSAYGVGTLLDLSSIESFDDGWNDGNYGGAKVHTVRAEAGGRINLSSVQSIAAPVQGNDRLDMLIGQGGGQIDLDSLATVTSPGATVRFDLNTSAFALPSLTSAQRTAVAMRAGGTLELPLLDTWSGGSLTVPVGGTFTAPQLSTVSGASLSIGHGGTFAATSLTDFTGSVLTLGASQTLNAPKFTNIDNSRFYLDGGAELEVAATGYSATGLASSQTLFSVIGPGTLLDLSSVGSFNDAFDDGTYGGEKVHTIRVGGSGRIDMSAVQSIAAPVQGNDRLEVFVDVGGRMDLDSLDSILATSGQTRVHVGLSTLTLPSLTSLKNTSVYLAPDGVLSAGLLETWTGGSISVPVAGRYDLLSLTTASGASLSIGQGGELVAPQLTSFTGGVLYLGASQTLSAPAFTAIDNTRFRLSDGAQLAVADLDYLATGLASDQTLFTVNGTGTLLDLSSVETFSDAFDDGYYGGEKTHSIYARSGGTIDLSSAATLSAPVQGNDRLNIHVESGGNVDLAALASTTATSGHLRLYSDQPSLELSSLTTAKNTSFFMRTSSTLDLPVLETWNGGSISVPTAGLFNAPQLTGVQNVTVSFGQDGELAAPQLTSFTSSVLYLGPSRILSASAFTAIDNSRFHLSGGASLVVAATGYSATGLANSQTPFRAEGVGTVLDLSSLTDFDDSSDDGYYGGGYVHTLYATAGGLIDLSGVATLHSPIRSNDRLDLLTDTLGRLDLSSLEQIVSAGSTVKIQAAGTVNLGSGLVDLGSGPIVLVSNGSTTAGTLILASGGTMTASGTLTGSFVNAGALQPGSSPGALPSTVTTPRPPTAPWQSSLAAPPRVNTTEWRLPATSSWTGRLPSASPTGSAPSLATALRS